MTTIRQVQLVQDSFAHIVPHTDDAAAAFYARLFVLAPETRALFADDMAAQGRKLFLTLTLVVDALDRIEEILPAVRALAVRHIGYGAQDHHYAAVGTALLDTLRASLGERFDAETQQAWTSAYGLLSDTMLAAVRAARPMPADAIDPVAMDDR